MCQVEAAVREESKSMFRQYLHIRQGRRDLERCLLEPAVLCWAGLSLELYRDRQTGHSVDAGWTVCPSQLVHSLSGLCHLGKLFDELEMVGEGTAPSRRYFGPGLSQMPGELQPGRHVGPQPDRGAREPRYGLRRSICGGEGRAWTSCSDVEAS
jgi:hypothetical protein